MLKIDMGGRQESWEACAVSGHETGMAQARQVEKMGKWLESEPGCWNLNLDDGMWRMRKGVEEESKILGPMQ